MQCYRYLWLYKYRKDLISPDYEASMQRLFDEGNDVEVYAQKLFPLGQKVQGLYEQAEKNTKRLIGYGINTLFQATAMPKDLISMADIFDYDKKKKVWNIYEVKRSSDVKELHIIDLAFQKVCFEEAGYKIGKTFVIHINREFVKQGEIDPAKLLKTVEVTRSVDSLLKKVKDDIKGAFKIINLKNEPDVKILKQCFHPFECSFIDYCWKNIPEQSIYNIAGGLNQEKIIELLDKGILHIKDIPPEYLTQHKALLHHKAVTSNKVYIDKQSIKKELSKVKYPLYFLDYEAFAPAIPIFDGFRAYQRVIFQFSLHVKTNRKSKVKHYAFLSDKWGDPTVELVKKLRKHIKSKGTLIAWNADYEKGCNWEMSRRSLKDEKFLLDINSRMYDLMQIFKKGYYVHKDFRGSASLKTVMPTLVPKLSYKDLEINQGLAASDNWRIMIDPAIGKDAKKKIYNNLLNYCHLDTLAMVEILKILEKIK